MRHKNWIKKDITNCNYIKLLIHFIYETSWKEKSQPFHIQINIEFWYKDKFIHIGIKCICKCIFYCSNLQPIYNTFLCAIIVGIQRYNSEYVNRYVNDISKFIGFLFLVAVYMYNVISFEKEILDLISKFNVFHSVHFTGIKTSNIVLHLLI